MLVLEVMLWGCALCLGVLGSWLVVRTTLCFEGLGALVLGYVGGLPGLQVRVGMVLMRAVR